MNADKWSRCDDLGRLVDHLAAHVPLSLTALVLCALADRLGERVPPIAAVAEELEAWAVGKGSAPALELAWTLERAAHFHGESSYRIASDLITAIAHPKARDGDTSHARRAAESIAEALARSLRVSAAEASALLAAELRALVPYVEDQWSWTRGPDGEWHTAELVCRFRGNRLDTCTLRSAE